MPPVQGSREGTMGHRRWGQLRPCHLFLLSQENRGFTGLIDFFPFPSLAVVFPRNHPALLTARTKSCSQQSPFSFGRTFANLGLKQGLHKLSLTIKFPGASNRVFQPFFFSPPPFLFSSYIIITQKSAFLLGSAGSCSCGFPTAAGEFVGWEARIPSELPRLH